MIISRYLTREVINTLLAVTIVLLLAFLCQQVVRYLNLIAVGKIPTNVLLQMIGFEVPYLLAILLPLGLYLAIILAYGRLYVDNEMAMLHQYGFGSKQVLRLTAMIGLLIAGIVLYLMIAINPWISAKRQKLMASDEAAIHLVETMIPGRFQVSPDGRHVMYVEKLSRDRQHAQTVFLAQEKKRLPAEELDQPSWTLVLANDGYQTQDKVTKEQYFVTTNGYRYEGTPGQNAYNIAQFKKYAVRIPPNDEHSQHQEDESLSTWQLWHDYANPTNAAQLQWRISIALSALLLALLAVPLSKVKPRQSRYRVLVPAILIYIVYINLLFIARRWVAQELVPVTIGMWWVHGLMLLLIIAILIFSEFNPRKGSS